MRGKLVGVVIVALLLILVFATAAMAGVSESTIKAILNDAADGTIDGNWNSGQIQAALAYLQDHPDYKQYSDIEGTLNDYLASLQAPGEQGGSLAFTGGEIFVILAAGAALIGGGALLRRRVPA